MILYYMSYFTHMHSHAHIIYARTINSPISNHDSNRKKTGEKKIVYFIFEYKMSVMTKFNSKIRY